MSRATLTLAGMVLGAGLLVVIARAQEAALGEPQPFPPPERASLSDGEPTPAVPRDRRAAPRYGEPTPATRPSQYQNAPAGEEPKSALVAKRPSAAERLQQVREATNRTVDGRTPSRGAAVIGPVTIDPANARGAPSSDETAQPQLIAPDTTPKSVRFQDTERSGGRSVLKKSNSSFKPNDQQTARRLLRSPSKPGDTSPTETVAAEPAIEPAPATKPKASPVGAPQSAAVLESRSSAVRVETIGPKSLRIGTEAIYTIRIHNEGDSEANDVFVRAGLPTTAKVVAEGASAEASPAGDNANEQRVVWTISRLAARTTENLTLRVTPTTNAPLDLFIDWTLRPISAVAQIEVQQPQLEMSVFGPKDIAYGEAAKYTIRLTNPGNGSADEVMVEFGYGQDRLEPKSVGTILPGQSQEISLELTARQSGALPVLAVATASGGLRAEASQELLVRRAALEAEIAGDAAVYAGTPANFRLVVRNAGNAAATQITATIALPQGAQLVRSGDDTKPAQNGLLWNVGSLPPNGERTLDLQCLLMTAGDSGISLRAVAAGDLEASKSFVTRVEALADLKLVVNDPQGPVAVGQDAVYEIHISNRGTKVATKVNVLAQFSPGIEPIEATGAQAELVPGQVLFQAIPRVDPGQEVTLIVRAKAGTAGTKRFRVEVSSEDSDTDLFAQETTYFFTEPGTNELKTSKVPAGTRKR